MSSPKPTLGYPSRTAAICGMRAQGLSTRQIAEAIGIAPKTIAALEAGSGRARAIRNERPWQELGRAVIVPVDVLNALSRHAARRNMHVNALARLIITTVVDDGMIDAVLDDEGGQ